MPRAQSSVVTVVGAHGGKPTNLQAQQDTLDIPAGGVCRSWWPPGQCPCRSPFGMLWCSRSEDLHGLSLQKLFRCHWSPRSLSIYQWSVKHNHNRFKKINSVSVVRDMVSSCILYGLHALPHLSASSTSPLSPWHSPYTSQTELLEFSQV